MTENCAVGGVNPEIAGYSAAFCLICFEIPVHQCEWVMKTACEKALGNLIFGQF